MSDTETTTDANAASEKKQTRRLNAKSIRRRVLRINAGTEDRKVRQKKGKLAISILERIASGEIKNPAAAAKAFLGTPDTETLATEAAAT
ncbi:MAG: hypothetical protein WBA67_12655 [Jannaschia sp.]